MRNPDHGHVSMSQTAPKFCFFRTKGGVNSVGDYARIRSQAYDLSLRPGVQLSTEGPKAEMSVRIYLLIDLGVNLALPSTAAYHGLEFLSLID